MPDDRSLGYTLDLMLETTTKPRDHQTRKFLAQCMLAKVKDALDKWLGEE
jgi:hypothetical protein